MLKKILIVICIFFIYGISNTNAAKYTSTLPEGEAHKEIEIALVAFVVEYLDAHGQDITDMNDFRWKVAEIITENGGRQGPDDVINQANIGAFAHVEGNKLYVGCGNLNFGFFELPVCEKYIKEWKESWGNCIISSDWTTDGKIECIQNKTYEKVEAECGYSYCGPKTCPDNALEPTGASGTAIKEISLNLESPVSNCTGIYANATSPCSLTLKTNPVVTNDDKPVDGLAGREASNILNSSKIPSDRINEGFDIVKNNALLFDENNKPKIEKNGSIFSLTIGNIRSVSPFSSEGGKIKFDLQGKNGTTSLEAKNIKYKFLKPFSGNLEVGSEGLIVSMIQTLKLNVVKDTDHLPQNTPSSYLIEDYKNTFKTENNDYTITNKDNEKDLTSNPLIDLKIDYDGTTDMGTTNVITYPYISYSLEGRNVKYHLSDNARDGVEYWDPNEISGIQLKSEKFLGVKIIGSQQLDGKYMVTGQGDNISDIAKLELKNKIRQNAYNLTKNMTPNTGIPLNGVQYYSDTVDIEISGPVAYETLIVKNGNVIISGDVSKNLGIIVLKDNYNVKTDYNKKGNVYIRPDVKYIEAIIYADGGFISVGDNNKPINSSPSRNILLSNQLVLKGSIFTKNTVGGALGATAGYLLPGGERTGDLNIATMYDFNYTRTGNDGANTLHNLGNMNHPFIIIYDPKVQVNPPKGFN